MTLSADCIDALIGNINVFMSESLNQLLNQFVQNSFKMFRNETNDFMSESPIFFYFSVFYSNSKTVINSETSDSNSEF